MSYLDTRLSLDSSMPLGIDLEMFVVSPTNTTYVGNQYNGEQHEHFSTNERVLITTDQVEIGEYTVHVYSHDPMNIGTTFALVAVGIFGSETLHLVPATEDVPCKNKGTPTENHVCTCPSGYIGLLCQTRVETISHNKSISIESLGALESTYFRWINPDPTVYWYLFFGYKGGAPPDGKYSRHMLYWTENTPKTEMPIEFDHVTTYDQYLTLDVSHVKELTGMIRNISPFSSPLTIQSIFLTGVTVTPSAATEAMKAEQTMNYKLGITGWILFSVTVLVGLSAFGLYIFMHRRQESCQGTGNGVTLANLL